MSSIAGAAGTLPTAELDRRFYAFTLDRLLAWSVYAVAAWAAYVLLLDDGRTVAGIAVIAGTVVGVSLVLSFVLGLLGTSPGKAAVGLRVVDDTTGTPIGVGPAVLRTLILGVAALPTFGIGVATLAMTAVTDRERQRRGWHDHLSRSVVVDVRPAPAQEEAAPERPRQIVNLTAMRLVPASATPPREIPTRARRARWAAGPTADPTGGLGQLEVAAVPEALATPVGVPTPGPTPDITPAAPASESGPAAPLADVASSEAAPSTPAPSAAAPLRPAGASRWTAATAPPRDPDALVTPVVSDVPTVRGLPRTVEEVTSDALAHPTGVPGGAAAGRPRRGRRASGRHAAPAATPTPPATPPAASFLPPGAAAPPTPTQLTPPSAPAPAPRWSVTFDTGEVFVVDGLTLVGRNPEARPGESVKRLLALPSQDMSLSKTHAQFQVVPDGALVMMDRGSTNGSLLVRGGVTRELGSGKPATLRHGDLVRFGDREMRVALSAGAPS